MDSERLIGGKPLVSSRVLSVFCLNGGEMARLGGGCGNARHRDPKLTANDVPASQYRYSKLCTKYRGRDALLRHQWCYPRNLFAIRRLIRPRVLEELTPSTVMVAQT